MPIRSVLDTVFSDIRFSVRSLRKSPGFLIVVVLSLALGIAANSTIFSVLNAVLYKPLPYLQPDRLVVVWQTEQGQPDSRDAPPIAEIPDWEKQNHVFDSISLSSWTDTNIVSGLGEPRSLHVQYASPNFFAQLGVEPILGRIPEASEAQDLTQTVVISYEFWQRQFHGDPQALGKGFDAEGVSSTIVGVMPQGFAPFLDFPVDFWSPINPQSPRYSARMDHWLMPVARLKPGVTVAQAQGEMDIIARRLEAQYPTINKGWGKLVVPLHDELFDGAGRSLYPLFGAVIFVLLIACVNVANLLQFRAETHRREYALRVSLGAGRRRLVQQLLTESALLALAGGILGIGLTFVGIKLFLSLAGDFPRAAEITVNPMVLLFTLAVSLCTAILFGLAPAMVASRPDLQIVLRQSERKTTTVAGRFARHALVVSEVALAMVLLVGAGLMINTMLRLQRVNPGFDTRHVLATDFQLPEGGKYLERIPGGDMEHTLPTVADFYRRLLEKTQALPGVESAGLLGNVPARCCRTTFSFSILGQPQPTDENRPTAGYSEASASVFPTMKIPLLRGRYLEDRDDAGAPWAIVVNQAFVQKYFPNQDPLGQQILLRYDPYPVDEQQPRVIVGVVGDVKQFGLVRPTPPFVYSSYLQQPAIFPGGVARESLHMGLVLRASSSADRGPAAYGPAGLVASLKQAVADIDPAQPLSLVLTMDQILSRSLGDQRFYMQLLGLFAAFAAILTAVGIYGVMSYSVNERTHEFGVRMALGAHRQDVLGLVASLALRLTAIGVVIGVALALGLTRLMSAILYGVKPSDPLTFTAVAVAITLVAMFACYVPAHRATQVDPLVALRHE